MTIETETTPKEKLAAAIAALGLSIKSTFVPFSQSRNKTEKHKSLNWTVTLMRNGRDVITTDYGAGCAHCPAYKVKDAAIYRNMRESMIAAECETGLRQRVSSLGVNGYYGTKEKIEPDALDVIHSLIMDSDVLESGGFEDWASNLGFDADSRKAESIYRACLEHALKLRAAIGEAGLEQLREAGQDY